MYYIVNSFSLRSLCNEFRSNRRLCIFIRAYSSTLSFHNFIVIEAPGSNYSYVSYPHEKTQYVYVCI